MGLKEELTSIKTTISDGVVANKVSKFAYTDTAYNENDVNGVATYDVTKEQNIPLGTPSVMKVNETVVTKGWRARASSITRMLMNHFLGRISYNLNKANDMINSMLSNIISYLGTANGIATLDTNGRIPYAQLPDSMVTLKGYWNASTNTPTLVDGTGTNGDEYIVDVAGSQDLGSGSQYFKVGDRVVYSSSIWRNIDSGSVKSVCNVTPDQAGNVSLAKGDVGLGNVANTGDSATPVSGGTTKFTTGGAYADKLATPTQNSTKNFTAGGAYNLSEKIENLRTGKAPIYHASSTPEYGVAGSGDYGHVRLSPPMYMLFDITSTGTFSFSSLGLYYVNVSDSCTFRNNTGIFVDILRLKFNDIGNLLPAGASGTWFEQNLAQGGTFTLSAGTYILWVVAKSPAGYLATVK